LLALALKDKMQYLEKHHGVPQSALINWNVFGSAGQLIRELVWSCLCAVSDQQAGMVRDEQAFAELLAATRSAIGAEFQKHSRRLAEALKLSGQVMRLLNADLESRRPEVFEDLTSQFEDLVYDGFLGDIEPDRLQHYPRYLQAMLERLERVELDPGRDARAMAMVHDHWMRYLDLIATGVEYGEELDHYRWLLEEYRVSLFAQKLGTAQKTSARKLADAWQQVPGAV
jgi:ATP-dependent helicase HrpA